MSKTVMVSGVALLGELQDGSAEYVANVQTFGGRYGNHRTRATALCEVMREKMENEYIVPCTITFHPPQKGKRR